MFYPNVIMLSQVYSMLCQQFVEDGMIGSMTTQLNMEESILGAGRAAIQIDPVTRQPATPIAVERASLQLPAPAAAKEEKSFESVMKMVGNHYGRRGARAEEECSAAWWSCCCAWTSSCR